MFTAAVWAGALGLVVLTFILGPGLAAYLCGPGLLLFMSLALVGRGNRWVWCALFPVVMAVLGVGTYGVFAMLPQEPAWLCPALAFASVPLLPSFLLFAAWRFRLARTSKEALP